ncbi:MAG: hypothetical protein IIA35_02665 [Proteobacteria bacterium]|nr:hypothetical protein [Pseudomonadota bacterium]
MRLKDKIALVFGAGQSPGPTPAVGNGRAIAYIGYLMEISPNDRRPAYSGYFNALIAPASLLPILGAGLSTVLPFATVFSLSLGAAVLQIVALHRGHFGQA